MDSVASFRGYESLRGHQRPHPLGKVVHALWIVAPLSLLFSCFLRQEGYFYEVCVSVEPISLIFFYYSSAMAGSTGSLIFVLKLKEQQAQSRLRTRMTADGGQE